MLAVTRAAVLVMLLVVGLTLYVVGWLKVNSVWKTLDFAIKYTEQAIVAAVHCTEIAIALLLIIKALQQRRQSQRHRCFLPPWQTILLKRRENQIMIWGNILIGSDDEPAQKHARKITSNLWRKSSRATSSVSSRRAISGKTASIRTREQSRQEEDASRAASLIYYIEHSNFIYIYMFFFFLSFV